MQQLVSENLKVVPPEDLLILSLESENMNWKQQLYFSCVKPGKKFLLITTDKLASEKSCSRF